MNEAKNGMQLTKKHCQTNHKCRFIKYPVISDIQLLFDWCKKELVQCLWLYEI